MLGGADNPNGELPSYITGADKPAICVKNRRYRNIAGLDSKRID